MSSVLRPSDVRVEALDRAEPAELARLVDTDPVVNAVVAVRLRAAGSLHPRRLGAEVLGVRDASGRLTAAALHGGNLVPVGGGPDDWRALGRWLASDRRVCSSIVGPAPAVEGMWDVLAGSWDPPRAVREVQPLLVLHRGAALPRAHPDLRPVRAADLDRYLPAAAAMFTEELGVSPDEVGSAAEYRRRMAALVRAGRSFAVVDEAGDVVFKADFGAVSVHTCQIQGVWVRPDRRGHGLGTSALAGVLAHALRLAPTASLYVNDFNEPARRMYARLGLRQLATLSTILF